jgi:DNA-binding response OmpR family regulator
VATHVLTAGGLRLDPGYRSVALDGVEVHLTAVEFDLLAALMRSPGRPFTRDDLLSTIDAAHWAHDAVYERTIDAHIKNLRHKLGGAGRQSRFIETVHGVGYRFVV